MNKKQIKQKAKKPKYKKTIDKNASKKAKTEEKQKVMIVAQELKFARLLAGNEKKSRDKVLKVLKKWLQSCFLKNYEFKEEDFLRVWKGLFYAVWMSDKPLVQEELCENISEILDQFPQENIDDALKMFAAGLRVLATEWYGIDQHRMDKFLMLARRYLRASFRLLHRMEWDLNICEKYSQSLSDKNGIFHPITPLFARNAISLLLHITDCFIEELSKVSQGKIPPESMAQLLHPFALYMCQGSEIRICVACRQLFNSLIRQSEIGLEYQERTKAWEQMGCPEGGPDCLAPVSDDDDSDHDHDGDGDHDDDNERSPLDPRAGRVNVFLTPLPVPSSQLVEIMKKLLLKANNKAHARVKVCMKRFEELSKNEYPLKVKDTDVSVVTGDKISVKKSSVKLTDFERKLKFDENKAALKNLSRKKRKKLLSRARSGEDVSEELEKIVASTNGKWNVEEETDPKKEKPKKRKLDKNTDNKKPDSPSKKLKLIVKDSKTKTKEIKKIQEEVKSVENKPVKKDKKPVIKEEETKIPVTNTKPVKKNFTKQDKVKLVIRSPKVEKAIKISKTPEKLITPKKVKFELKKNSMQKPIDYYKSVRQSPNIPYDSDKKPVKTNLKPNSAPSPINPFFKKKLRIK